MTPPPVERLPGRLYQAVYPYQAQDAEELSFSEGDLISVQSEHDENWYMGECKGRRGAIPKSYVAEIKQEVERVIATADYEAARPNELSIRNGEVVNVLYEDGSGWASGYLKGNPHKRGWFPLTYTEPYKPVAGRTRSMSGVTPPPVMLPPPAAGLFPAEEPRYFCTVLYPYDPTSDAEQHLQLLVGDTVAVFRQDPSGWWKGQSYVSKKKGWFPSPYVAPAAKEHVQTLLSKLSSNAAIGVTPAKPSFPGPANSGSHGYPPVISRQGSSPNLSLPPIPPVGPPLGVVLKSGPPSSPPSGATPAPRVSPAPVTLSKPTAPPPPVPNAAADAASSSAVRPAHPSSPPPRNINLPIKLGAASNVPSAATASGPVGAPRPSPPAAAAPVLANASPAAQALPRPSLAVVNASVNAAVSSAATPVASSLRINSSPTSVPSAATTLTSTTRANSCVDSA